MLHFSFTHNIITSYAIILVLLIITSYATI